MNELSENPTVPTDLTPDQLTEFQTILTDIKGCSAEFKNLPGTIRSLQEENGRLSNDLAAVRRSLLSQRSTLNPQLPRSGRVSDDCARRIAATFIQHCARSGALEARASQSTQRDALLTFARESLGISTRTALTTSDIPLPSEYSGEQ